MTDITAIVAAHNDAEFISDCLRSIKAAGAAEIIVVDDASSDNTLATIEALCIPEIRVITLAQNSGPSVARNTGLENASNDLCAMIDADDEIPPDRLDRLKAVMRETDATAVVDDLRAFHNDTGETLWRRLDRVPMDGSRRALTALDMIRYDLGSLKPLLDRSKLGRAGLEYPAAIRRGEDFLFLLSILKGGGKIVATTETAYYLRRRTTGRLTSDRRALYSELLRHQIRFQLSNRLTIAEHLALLRRHLGNFAGLAKSSLKAQRA
ncbi:glycosyltransferase family 2 protein [Qipengyuania sp. XHP0211]|uniref:glycosyltransferase family 2 protein n=1 Tax=Qipengyuania sp. XHP0211 TaxID=3038079 RepID=UPI00241C38FB|nr:glycosyltransferase family 2 protein [Qipengyuania sp. XHP0211]MDG5750974.1 glycosyltransferase family 2 protein [Qipengyuania sp. XHP0211]